MTRISISRLAGWALTAMTLVLAALLVSQCAGIYLAGTSAGNISETGVYINPVYSPDIVAERFSQISWAFWAWLALLAASAILRAFSGEKADKGLKMTPEYRLKLIKSRAELTSGMRIEENKRRMALVICAVICAICAVKIAMYFANPVNFASRELEGVMGEMLKNVTPWILVAFASLTALVFLSAKSAKRELEAAKSAPKREPDPLKAPSAAPLTAIRVALYIAAAAFIVAGIINGGMYDVLVKAVNICTECIGLG